MRRCTGHWLTEEPKRRALFCFVLRRLGSSYFFVFAWFLRGHGPPPGVFGEVDLRINASWKP